MKTVGAALKKTPGWVIFFMIAFFIYFMGKTFGKN